MFLRVQPQHLVQSIRDERGLKVELGHMRLRESVRFAQGAERERLAELDRRVRRVGRPFRISVGAFFILLGTVLAPLVVWTAFKAGAAGPARLGVLAAPLVMISLGVLVLRTTFGYSGPRVRDIVLDGGLCASCLAVLSRAAEPDGCTVCPECGAAWRLHGR